MVEPKINSRAFYCGQFMFPTLQVCLQSRKKLLKEHVGKDRDYTFGQAMGEVFLEFVGNIFVGALDNLLFKKR